MELSNLSIADLRAVILTLKEKEELYYTSHMSSVRSSLIKGLSLNRQEVEDHLDKRLTDLGVKL